VGRKLIHKNQGELNAQSMARSYTAIAIKTLVSICLRGESENARVAAAATLLQRGWGKPNTVPVEDDGSKIVVEIVYPQPIARPPKLIDGQILNGSTPPHAAP